MAADVGHTRAAHAQYWTWKRWEIQMQITISPERAPLDLPVAIRLAGLEAGRPVTVRAQMAGYVGGIWASAATFVADAAGTVDLTRDAPASGADAPFPATYEGVDPMGLFWSMRREPDSTVDFDPTANLTVTLTAEVDDQTVTTTTIERQVFADNVVGSRVREQGLVGACFRPRGDATYPGVLVMGGSGGGLGGAYWQAALLARHGFAVLAVAYFKMESLPTHLHRIPLEYFETAMGWLTAQPGVQGDGVGVIGTSRGGELVLLLGATYPQVKAVVAYVPSHVVWRGGAPGVPDPAPAWTLGGEPIPLMRATRPPTTPPPTAPVPGVPYVGAPGFLRSLEDREAEVRAAIPVERIGGPVLLISGRDDRMWPSALMAGRAAERLAAHNHPYPDENHAYAGAGHAIFLPSLPTTETLQVHPVHKNLNDLGGTPRAIAHASADSWPRVVRFLHDSLHQ
jgi:dienelactone hydrolase